MGYESRDRERQRGVCAKKGEESRPLPSRPGPLDSPLLDAESNSFAVKA